MRDHSFAVFSSIAPPATRWIQRRRGIEIDNLTTALMLHRKGGRRHLNAAYSDISAAASLLHISPLRGKPLNDVVFYSHALNLPPARTLGSCAVASLRHLL
jgi:hypothetical protein